MQSLLTILSDAEIEKIHEATLDVLEKTGVEIEAPHVVDNLKRNGAKTDGSRVRFPKEMVSEWISIINREVNFAAIDKEESFMLPKKKFTYNSTAGYSPYIYQNPNDERRPATSSDLAKIARLCDGLDSIDFFWPIVTPSEECITELEEISALNTTLRNIGKHIECSVSTEGGARYQIMLARAVSGGEKNLRENPIFSVVASPTTPLSFESGVASALSLMAEAGVPVSPMNVPMAGTTAPGTFAGTLVVTNAEQLAALMIVKSVNKEAPMVYAADTGSADLRTGDMSYDNPDYDLFSVACGQLANFYNIPSSVSHGSCEEREFSTPAGLERNVLKTALSQMTYTDTSCWIGSRDNCLSTSIWDIVLDAEVASLTKAYQKETEVNDNTLAIHIVNQVGPRGEFLSQEHTYKNFRREICLKNFSDSEIFNCEGNYIDYALGRADNILSSDPKEYLCTSCITELDEIVKAARKEFEK